MNGTQLVWAIIKILVMIGFIVNTAALLTWLDRRQGAAMQDRVGPNRAVTFRGLRKCRNCGEPGS